jgi:hypothetical protein
MRIEILKYLSDTHEFKPLNDLLKSINKNDQLTAVKRTLDEMYIPGLDSNVIELKGDYQFLGQRFADLPGIGKTFSYTLASDNPPPDIKDLVIGIGDLDNCQITGRITYKGRIELENYELNQSIKTVNDSVRKTNKLTAWVAILAGVFSLTSLFISLITIGKSSQVQVEELKETNKILQTQVKSLQDFLFDLDRKHLIPARKDSLSE